MDDYGANNSLTESLDRCAEILDLMVIEEGDSAAIKMNDVLYVGRMGYLRAVILGGDEGIRAIQKGYPGFTYIELRELANRLRVRAAIGRLE